MIAAIVANVREDLNPALANAAAASVRARIEDHIERGFVGTGEACRHISAGIEHETRTRLRDWFMAGQKDQSVTRHFTNPAQQKRPFT